MSLSLCVFCGSGSVSDFYLNQGKKLGTELAKRKIRLIYGGASIGVMGAVADGCLEEGGEVVGVIPKHLVDWEIAHKNLTKLHIVDSMHSRKELMYNLSNAFVAIYGGMGTLDELCEIVTWRQLKCHEKPIFLFNDNGFYNYLIKHFVHIQKEGFLSKGDLDIVQEVRSFKQLFEKVSYIN